MLQQSKLLYASIPLQLQIRNDNYGVRILQPSPRGRGRFLRQESPTETQANNFQLLLRSICYLCKYLLLRLLIWSNIERASLSASETLRLRSLIILCARSRPQNITVWCSGRLSRVTATYHTDSSTVLFQADRWPIQRKSCMPWHCERSTNVPADAPSFQCPLYRADQKSQIMPILFNVFPLLSR